MPGQRGEKQQGHREALLRSSLDSSSAAVVGGSGNSPATHTLLETDTSLPNTITSGQVARIEPGDSAELTQRSTDGQAESGTEPWGAPLINPPSASLLAAAPAPAPARLSSRQISITHPLSPSSPSIAGSGRGQLSPGGGAAASPPAPTVNSSRVSTSFSGGSPAAGGCAVEAAGSDASSCPGPPNGGLVGFGGFAPECRICLLAEPMSDLVTACHCTGSLAYAHLTCLRTWVMEKRSVHCELCGTMYKEPYGSELATSIPPAPPAPQSTIRRLTTPDGQPIFIMPVGVGLGPGAMGPLLQHHSGPGGPAMMAGGMGMGDARDMEPQPLCEWRNMWSYALILLLLLFAIIYVTVISKRGRQEPWMMTLWQVLLVVLPIYLVLRIAFDLYRHRLAQQLAAANLQAMALANAAADAAAAAGHPQMGAHGMPREVIITRQGNRVLVLQRTAQ